MIAVELTLADVGAAYPRSQTCGQEKVMALKARKSELFASVMDSGNAFGGGLDADDIRGLLA